MTNIILFLKKLSLILAGLLLLASFGAPAPARCLLTTTMVI